MSQRDTPDKRDPKPSRRQFIKGGLGVIAATQLGTLAACGGASPTDPGGALPTNPREIPPSTRTPVDPSSPTPTEPRDPPVPANTRSKVYLVETQDRTKGIPQIMAMAGLGFAANRKVLIKPNLVSTEKFPATTHDGTLRLVVRELKEAGATEVILGESSGLGRTKGVIAGLGTEKLCKELGIEWLNFDTMPAEQWSNFSFPDMNWQGELAIPKVIRDKDIAVVLLPCCKTHGAGGHFTMSLKLAVGITPVDRRGDLHSAGNIPEWAADINAGFTPDLIVMDALSCFIDGGPTSGTVAHPGLLVASHDRVALDAVGLAILKAAGSNTSFTSKKIFEQPQIARAAKLKLGVSSPDQIELVGNDGPTLKKLQSILDIG